jgi:hypothetical protein
MNMFLGPNLEVVKIDKNSHVLAFIAHFRDFKSKSLTMPELKETAINMGKKGCDYLINEGFIPQAPWHLNIASISHL